ncbi:HlyD family secretion protein [Shimia gijangensis]|uniref:HlyD family secretion protein n=1 Tax=Shimia gijangensis TaxID=1470563 RepID=A0A1M6CVV4_9RHOB|nr:HlyD family efflux transporter periplasmic adaptor subunit [Shimia gijangensis]SHI65116.1 HlyD family secretion protein [Shimia gijangensis]
MAKKQSRRFLTLIAVALVGAGLATAFWPKPALVDLGEVRRGAMMQTVDEEARTRVRDPYVVSTPIAGHLLRVDLQPGDHVVKGETVVARMMPTNPSALDVRTREQARAAIAASEAALRVSEADLNKAMADRDFARTDLDRAKSLYEKGNVPQATLDRASSLMRAADAMVDTARAAISMRIADLNNARATLIGFDDAGFYAGAGRSEAIDLPSPITGVVLQVIQQSETILPAGAPVLEVGDTGTDLEVVVELLSTDAVQVHVGDRVLITNWGGAKDLNGTVERIDPWGFTKYSALGVEEQRVNAVIRFTDPPESLVSLGHGFRVETRIVVWEAEDIVIAPSSALFRDNGNWAVFVVQEGAAILTPVVPGQNNGLDAQIIEGLEAGQGVILYPSAGLSDGAKVASRAES